METGTLRRPLEEEEEEEEEEPPRAPGCLANRCQLAAAWGLHPAGASMPWPLPLVTALS
jgi:hypothetical protein